MNQRTSRMQKGHEQRDQAAGAGSGTDPSLVAAGRWVLGAGRKPSSPLCCFARPRPRTTATASSPLVAGRPSSALRPPAPDDPGPHWPAALHWRPAVEAGVPVCPPAGPPASVPAI
jgi:hypothetical protein